MSDIHRHTASNDISLDADPAVYKTLLESTRAIPWRIDWATATFTYIGPQIEELLGWEPSSWKTVEDWATRMHPDERAWAVDFCVAQSRAGVDHEADYRALTRDGRYVWIRDVVHVVRNQQGEVEALVGFMFDISERKKNEQKLLELQRELERLSFKDGLTGVGNRRHFENVLEHEWQQAQASRQPLSVVMIDIDFFKQYNDRYGHVAGDDCLRRVGRLLDTATGRPRDFLARFGGEEFVLVLPDTDADTALRIAGRCREVIAAEAIPHESSPISRMLSVSMGVGTRVPDDDKPPLSFIAEVDRSLYLAKHRGRNRIVAGSRVD